MSLCTTPPHVGQTSTWGSENFWICSNRIPQAPHSYWYSGIYLYFSTLHGTPSIPQPSNAVEQIVGVLLAEHQLTVHRQRPGPIAEQCVVKLAQ